MPRGIAELTEDDHACLLFDAGYALQLTEKTQRCIDHPEILEIPKKGIPPQRSLSEEIDDLETIYRIVRQRE